MSEKIFVLLIVFVSLWVPFLLWDVPIDASVFLIGCYGLVSALVVKRYPDRIVVFKRDLDFVAGVLFALIAFLGFSFTVIEKNKSLVEAAILVFVFFVFLIFYILNGVREYKSHKGGWK